MSEWVALCSARAFIFCTSGLEWEHFWLIQYNIWCKTLSWLHQPCMWFYFIAEADSAQLDLALEVLKTVSEKWQKQTSTGNIWKEMDEKKMDLESMVRKWKKKYHLVHPRITMTLNQISYNYLNLFIPFRIDCKSTTITPLPGSRCGLDSRRKWKAIKETAGATISLGNVCLGDDHITIKALCGVLGNAFWQISQWYDRLYRFTSLLFMSLP